MTGNQLAAFVLLTSLSASTSSVHAVKDSPHLDQIDAKEKCITFTWRGFSVRSTLLEFNLTNNRTGEQVSYLVPNVIKSKTVCNLELHQSYRVSARDPKWASRKSIEKIMWTLQAVPDYPPIPQLVYTTDTSIKIMIFATKIDLNKGPFTGFDIRIQRASDTGDTLPLDNSSSDPIRSRREAGLLTGRPQGQTVGFINTNQDVEFLIGQGNSNHNKPLEKDTEYVVYVGVVSMVAYSSTHAYVSMTAATRRMNIHIIVMVLCFIVGSVLLTYVMSFLLWKRKRMEEDALRAKEWMLMYHSDLSDTELFSEEIFLNGDWRFSQYMGDIRKDKVTLESSQTKHVM
ncbi:uncharacterized protein LOC131956650 isoform X2 [Physella acuta]|uniref:uncharacterized protein LOC131956650 isoform X2 n=1 Tax=Physella acuta TaxID=109671 RepID=UPI0027DCACC5|nr:uncharacterized protein LOC131956650 isoform X2 [Physella acuta]